MPIKRCAASINVVQAAKNRIKNVFSNDVPVYMSFSGGKDSLVLGNLVYSMLQRGEIRPDNLVVQFIDEEAIFPCIEKTVIEWRSRFLLAGAKFEWYCIEVRHYNCFNELASDESFMCWDSRKQDVWVRTPPKFAIRNHPLLIPRSDTYQRFLEKRCADGITITGVRAAESFQRLQYMSRMNMGVAGSSDFHKVFPIYDWSTNDVWLYLQQENIQIPEIYLHLWQAGTNKNQMRVSQFFSNDTAKSLVKMNEYYPDLMERIIRREPNAYLAALYWDSEMFGRRTASRKALEGEAPKDYKALLFKMFSDMPRYFNTEHKMAVAKQYRHLFMRVGLFATKKDYQRIYDALMRGDPKLRTYRAVFQSIYGVYNRAETVVKQNGR